MRLTITRTLAVGDLGTVAFIGVESVALAFGSCHRVRVTRPDGESVEAVASVEAVRNDASGDEFPALLFELLEANQVVPGSSVVVLAEVLDQA